MLKSLKLTLVLKSAIFGDFTISVTYLQNNDTVKNHIGKQNNQHSLLLPSQNIFYKIFSLESILNAGSYCLLFRRNRNEVLS